VESGNENGTFDLGLLGLVEEEGATMLQALLPLISEDATRISDLISVVRQDGDWFYFCGTQPVFQHREGDLRSFRMFTAQLCVQGACKQADIIKALAFPRAAFCGVSRSIAKKASRGFTKRVEVAGRRS
jgi:hypothetical protein